jgi:hypothetical protein
MNFIPVQHIEHIESPYFQWFFNHLKISGNYAYHLL